MADNYTNIVLNDINGNEVHPKTNFDWVIEPESGKTLAEVLEGLDLSGSASPDGLELKYDEATGKLTLLSGETELASATIPSGSSSLKSVSIEDTDPNDPESEAGKYLVFEWSLSDGSTSKTAVNLSDIVDLSGYATTEDLETLESSLPDKFCVATVESDTGVSRMQNEASGTGPMYRHVDGTYSYTGVNNGGADGIGVQTYVKNNETNVGTRINVYTKGAYYIPNMSNTDENYVADGDKYEIAVKGDLDGLATTTALEALLARVVALENAGGSSSGSTDLSDIQAQIDALKAQVEKLAQDVVYIGATSGEGGSSSGVSSAELSAIQNRLDDIEEQLDELGDNVAYVDEDDADQDNGGE